MSALFENYALTVLEAKRRSGGVWADFRCRVHDDRSASCSINMEDGRVHCQAKDCGWEGWVDQYAEQCFLPVPPDKPGWVDGKPVRDDDLATLKTGTPLSDTRPRPSATYPYDDTEGRPYRRVQRVDLGGGKKTFWQSAFVDGEWTNKIPKEFPPILYRLRELLARKASLVLVCEGEKGADCARRLGFPATTTPCGACNADKVEDWTGLAGADAVIIRDNDEIGLRHARQVAGLLIGIAKTIRIITMPDVPAKGDLVDWVDAGGTAEGLRELIEATPAFGMPVPLPPPPTVSRVFLERAFLCNAWDDDYATLEAMAYPDKAFKDPGVRSAIRAMRRLRDQGRKIEQLAARAEMDRYGDLHLWNEIDEWQHQRLKQLGASKESTKRDFAESVCRDNARDAVAEIQKQLDRGDYKMWCQAGLDRFTHLAAEAETEVDPTLHDDFLAWADRFLHDRHEVELFSLGMGPVDGVACKGGPGRVFIIGGSPKTGKSSLAMAPIFENAEKGMECLVGQLEMTRDDVCARAAAWYLEKPLHGPDGITKSDIRRVINSGELDWFRNIHLVTGYSTLEGYRAAVTAKLAKNRRIKLLLTDYAEMIMKHGTGVNRVDEADGGSKFAKDIAVAFGICHIFLVQYGKAYTENGHGGARLNHLKNSGKYEQDASVVILLHHPHRFNNDITREYVIANVAANRHGGTGEVGMRWRPELYRYEPWEGPVPAGVGRNLAHNVALTNQTNTAVNKAKEALLKIPMDTIPL